MRLRSRRTYVTLALLVVAAPAAYWGGTYLWARHHYRAAEDALGRRDFRQAGAHLAKYLSARPNDPAARLLAAQAARRRGDYGEALDRLRDCGEDREAAADIALERRLLLVQQGQLADADALLGSCFQHPRAPETPLIVEAYLEGSLRVMEDGPVGGGSEPDPEAARRAVELWLRLRTAPADRAQGLVWRGRLERFGDEPGRALADLREAVELGPDCFEARMQLAWALAYDHPGEALVHLQRLRERYPENRDVCFTLATVRRSLNELDQAAQLLDELLAADPDNVSYLVERGYVAMNARQLDDAERRLRRALALAPESPSVYLALSGCLYLAGRESEAKQYLDRGQELSRAVRAPGGTARPHGKPAAGREAPSSLRPQASVTPGGSE